MLLTCAVLFQPCEIKNGNFFTLFKTRKSDIKIQDNHKLIRISTAIFSNLQNLILFKLVALFSLLQIFLVVVLEI